MKQQPCSCSWYFASTNTAACSSNAAMDQADEESIGAAVSFKVNDATTITLHTAETDDGQKTESTQTQVLRLRIQLRLV